MGCARGEVGVLTNFNCGSLFLVDMGRALLILVA